MTAKVRAGAAMLFIAVIAAVISYNDGLFVARLAGNHGRLAYLYPLLPDGLIVICLIALYEAARARVPRPRWATAGLVLGAGLTLAMNVGAGAAHGRLDMVVDGMVPVVFFVAVEVLIWLIRHGRGAVQASIPRDPPAVTGTAPPRAPVRSKLPTVREIQSRQHCSQETARKIRTELATYERSRGGTPHSPAAPAAQDVPAGVPAAMGTAPAPAGAWNGQAGAHG